VTFKNFFSVGNNTLRYDLDTHQNTILLGKNSAGKCCDKNTEIHVRVYGSARKFFGDAYTRDTLTTIGKVYDFYKRHPECKGNVEVKGRYGYYPIEDAAITAKNSEVYFLSLESGKTLRCSPEHKVWANSPFSEDSWRKASSLVVGDKILTESGWEKLLLKSREDKREDLYDIQVGFVHEYYSNGILSHNSLINEAIVFGLYGKPFRKVNKSQIVNTLNKKECLVTLDFSINGKDYRIKRGIKPNIFEVYVEGTLAPTLSSVKEQQEWLENVIKISYKTFTHVVILGNCNFTPFMEKTSADRRAFIEDTLGLNTYSQMKSVTNDRIKAIKKAQNDLNLTIDGLKSQEKLAIKSIDNFKKILEEHRKQLEEEEETLKEDIANGKEELLFKTKSLEEVDQEILLTQNPKELISNLEKQKFSLSNQKNNFVGDIQVYKNHSKCPMCKQDISASHKKEKLLEIREKVEESTSLISDIDKEIDKLKEDLKKFNSLLETRNSILSEIRYIENFIKFNKEKLNKKVIPPSDGTLTDLETDLKNIRAQLEGLNEASRKNAEELSLLEAILDSYEPVKQQTIKAYIPVINNYLRKYLDILGLDATFAFDYEFKEEIISKYKESFSYSSFSEGEKMRINLALLLTWREICKLKNNAHTNLLILDEVTDSSLDSEGMTSFLDLIKTLGGNVFIISHREEAVSDHFERVGRVFKNRSTNVRWS